jgi:4-cresol dehydrogenase (hydroxylating)
MGFWLMPPPENFATGVVTVPRFHDIGPLEQSKIVLGL